MAGDKWVVTTGWLQMAGENWQLAGDDWLVAMGWLGRAAKCAANTSHKRCLNGGGPSSKSGHLAQQPRFLRNLDADRLRN